MVLADMLYIIHICLDVCVCVVFNLTDCRLTVTVWEYRNHKVLPTLVTLEAARVLFYLMWRGVTATSSGRRVQQRLQVLGRVPEAS